MKRVLLVCGLLVVGAILLFACTPPAPVVQEVTREVKVDVTRMMTVQVTQEVTKVVEVQVTQAAPAAVSDLTTIEDKWSKSGHADSKAEAFIHWDAADPKEVPVGCAKCHSSAGFLDNAGADGKPGTVDAAAAIGSVITCNTCHSDASETLTSVTFPSGKVISGLGREAVCMTCHSGRSSKIQVDEAVTKAAVADDDTVSDKIPFVNIHYFAAAAIRYGKDVQGGYEYDGKEYDALFDHEGVLTTCQDCHDQHSLEVKLEACAQCHDGVKTIEDVRKIRMAGSTRDYDGDTNIEEPIADEIKGLSDLLLTAIQTYAKEISKVEVAYNAAAYPYFFVDTNKDGKADEAESVSANAFKAWTGRLLKAAYNYQLYVKDPGAYAHNGKYVIQLMNDSIVNLNEKITAKIDMSLVKRNDSAHFRGSALAFRDWDADGAVPANCAKCHSGGGLAQFIKEGTNVSQPVSSGFECTNCHDVTKEFAPYAVKTVAFPSGAKLTFGEGAPANLCLVCHQGRESSVSVEKFATANKEADKPVEKSRFLNVHYLAAGATLFGSEAKGAYQYAGKEYAGKFPHVANVDTCIACHDKHTLRIKEDACLGCHAGIKGVEDIRIKLTGDYDGDGDVAEGLAGEVEGLKGILLTEIQAYAKDKLKLPIVYSEASYPYWFNDLDGDGTVNGDEGTSANAYATWSPRMLEAAYNYQYAMKDPGAFAHNGTYIMQILVDSIKDLGSKAPVTRP